MTDQPEAQPQITPKSCLDYVAAALAEYAATFPPSVRGPFQAEALKAVKTIEAALARSAGDQKP